MNGKYTFAILIVIILAVLSGALVLSHGHTIAMFDPQGSIALQERNLMITAALLMLLVIVPVFLLTFGIAWRYRAGNTKARYTPNWEHNKVEEFIWWAVPCVIIVVLAFITWTSSHKLDPFKPLSSNVPPLTIEVVALNWKWLFIYPEQHIATLNVLEIPEQTPINFEVTADAPMNSFWIPQLGGQIYAMTGMVTQLHLMADGPGSYRGLSANFSGAGFSGMTFTTTSVSPSAFNAWVYAVQQSPQTLDAQTYTALESPSENNPAAYYASTMPDLFSTILMKFMGPMQESSGMDMGGADQ